MDKLALSTIEKSDRKIKNCIIRMNWMSYDSLTASEIVGYTLLHKLNFVLDKTKHMAPKYIKVLKTKEKELWKAMRASMTKIDHFKAQY